MSVAIADTENERSSTNGSDSDIPVMPMIIRGEVIEDELVEFQGRGDSMTFAAPDPRKFLDRIPLASPAALADLYELSFAEILDYLAELGERLDPTRNEHMQWARELTYAPSPQTKPLIDNNFRAVSSFFRPARVSEIADRTIGLDHLNSWVETTLADGTVSSVRAFGSRALHIIPGNGGGPASAVGTIIRNAITRSDCIIKTPSNNPFTAVAIARTMCEIAPDHPLTKHVAVAYWRGGDEELEARLCQPHNIDKLVAWGGLASVKHVTRYIQPGLELVALDPKYSASVVGPEVFDDEATMREVALRMAVDVGTSNQTACSAARVVYVITGDRPDGAELAQRLGAMVYEELVVLPDRLSTSAKSYDPELRANVDALRLQDEWYSVIGGDDGEGCVIVSQLPDAIDFTELLADRTVNIVPVDTLEDVLPKFDSYTQTVGVYPNELQARLRDVAPLYGVQRLVPLGYSGHHTWCGPHDGLELERRLCKWIVSLEREPGRVATGSDRDAGHWVEPDVMPGTLDALRYA
jgi:Acyl-CoA reductase (LuxC)